MSTGVFILLSFFGYMVIAYLFSLKKRTKDLTKSQLGVIDSTRVANKIVRNDFRKCMDTLEEIKLKSQLESEQRKEQALLEYKIKHEEFLQKIKKFSKEGESPVQTWKRLENEFYEEINRPIGAENRDHVSQTTHVNIHKQTEKKNISSYNSNKEKERYPDSFTESNCNYHYKRLNELTRLHDNFGEQSKKIPSINKGHSLSQENIESNKEPRIRRKARTVSFNILDYTDSYLENWAQEHAEQRKNSQKTAIRELNSGKNVFLTGGAGTGKSYVLREFIKQNRDKSILITAPTGIAANNIQGSTLHRTFKLPLGIISEKIISNEDSNRWAYRRNLLAHTDILIIDEISMCRADVFSYIVDLLSDAAYVGFHIQVVLCGDFFQLPPVVGASEKETFQKLFPNNVNGWCFLTEQWKKLNLTTCTLDKVYRQDNLEFVTALNQIRKGDSKGIDFININYCRQEISTAVSLVGTNSLAAEINMTNLEKINSATHEYDIVKEGRVSDSDIRCEQHLSLKIGARVIILINDSSGDLYHNGTFGTVVDVAPDRIKVSLDESKIIVELPKHTWEIYGYELDESSRRIKKNVIGKYKQIPVRLGWAVTIHKSQGSTYDAVNLKSTRFWDYGQLYVALSRCKDVRRLYIPTLLSKLNLKVSSEVEEFSL